MVEILCGFFLLVGTIEGEGNSPGDSNLLILLSFKLFSILRTWCIGSWVLQSEIIIKNTLPYGEGPHKYSYTYI